MGREYHISVKGDNKNSGSREQPFQTIQRAADVAMPGDVIIVHEGIYRECVNPVRGGRSDASRITYMAAPGEKAVIKGSEVIKGWQKEEGNVWKVKLRNSFFGDYNPYLTELYGDWFMDPYDRRLHVGDVYLNGTSFYEARNLEELKEPVMRTDGFNPPWTKRREKIKYPENTLYQWYAEADEENTTIYANFRGKDPNEEEVEINVRKACFYPSKTGRNYITVKGFEMSQAATFWAPPTGDQPGLIATNWSKGWIIEDNIIHDAKCSAISIGKEESTGNNDCKRGKRKPGYQYQMEAVFKALHIGWSKETIGSHIIRNNTIYDCGQNAVVGHLGCIFSEIYGNHIYNIAVKHEYYGYEIAGIKLHTAIDVYIHDNNIHDCTLGIWLDWQAQGARVSKNLFYRNDRDLFIEVTHGPHLVDHNLFLSEYFFDNIAWGGAYVNNLICGTMRREPVLNRATPYHYPHSTEPLGTTFVYGGDDRWIQNIFVGGAPVYTEQSISGTSDYDGCPESFEEYLRRLDAIETPGDLENYEKVKEAVYFENNSYLNGATSYNKEENSLKSGYDPHISVEEEEGKVYLHMEVSPEMMERKGRIIKTKDLGEVRIVEMAFEQPDGSQIVFCEDYLGESREEESMVGPFADLKEGVNKIRVW